MRIVTYAHVCKACIDYFVACHHLFFFSGPEFSVGFESYRENSVAIKTNEENACNKCIDEVRQGIHN